MYRQGHQKGRLAQLVERFIDIEKVIGPIPIPPTKSIGCLIFSNELF